MIWHPKNTVEPLGLLGICTLSENNEILKIFQDFYENMWKYFLENWKCGIYEKHDFEKVLTHVGTGNHFSYFYWKYWK